MRRRQSIAFFSSILVFTFVTLLAPVSASALTLTLSDRASSEGIDPLILDATFDFVVVGGDTLELTVTNTTTAPNEFNVNEIYFNALDTAVSGLTLLSAQHSAAGDVLAGWSPVATNVMVNGWGTFDFGLQNGVGETDPTVIGPSEDILFTFSIAGACAGGLSCDMNDFLDLSSGGDDGRGAAAAKFVNGPGDASSFGTVPEPSTALLLALGLGSALVVRRR